MPSKPNPRDVLLAARASQQRAEESSQTVKQSKTERVKKLLSNDSNTQLLNNSISQTLPKYAQLVPFNLRLREDQVTALAELERVVMKRRKQKGGERITKNTLIRVAVDYLLQRGFDIAGDNEELLLVDMLNKE